MSIYHEKPASSVNSLLVVFSAFIIIFMPWLIGERELFWREAEYALMAHEFSLSHPIPTLFHEPIVFKYPLFPFLAGILMNLGWSVEWALRGIGIFASSIIAIICFYAAYSATIASNQIKKERKEIIQLSEFVSPIEMGSLAAIASFSSLIMIDRGVLGYPDMLALAFIFGGWLLWFSLGYVAGRWNLMWVCVGGLLLCAFFTQGLFSVLIFIIPFIFMRRPLSIWSRLKNPIAILVGITIFGIIIFYEGYRSQILEGSGVGGSNISNFFNNDYPFSIIMTPFDLLIRLFPWGLLAWPVFCPAYITLDRNPVFSQYLRTITLAVLGVLLFVPVVKLPDDLKILLPLVALLVTIHYPLFVRRYGLFCNHILKRAGWLAIGVGIILFGISCWSVYDQNSFESWGKRFELAFSKVFFLISIEKFTLFLNEMAFWGLCVSCLIIIIGIILLHTKCPRMTIWIRISLIMMGISLLIWFFVRTHQSQDRSIHQFAENLEKSIQQNVAMEGDSDTDVVIYKDSMMSELYAECAYLRRTVKKVRSVDQILIPEFGKSIYYMSSDVPTPSKNLKWKEEPVFRQSNYNKKTIFLWVGTAGDMQPKKNTKELEPILLLP